MAKWREVKGGKIAVRPCRIPGWWGWNTGTFVDNRNMVVQRFFYRTPHQPVHKIGTDPIRPDIRLGYNLGVASGGELCAVVNAAASRHPTRVLPPVMFVRPTLHRDRWAEIRRDTVHSLVDGLLKGTAEAQNSILDEITVMDGLSERPREYHTGYSLGGYLQLCYGIRFPEKCALTVTHGGIGADDGRPLGQLFWTMVSESSPNIVGVGQSVVAGADVIRNISKNEGWRFNLALAATITSGVASDFSQRPGGQIVVMGGDDDHMSNPDMTRALAAAVSADATLVFPHASHNYPVSLRSHGSIRRALVDMHERMARSEPGAPLLAPADLAHIEQMDVSRSRTSFADAGAGIGLQSSAAV